MNAKIGTSDQPCCLAEAWQIPSFSNLRVPAACDCKVGVLQLLLQLADLLISGSELLIALSQLACQVIALVL